MCIAPVCAHNKLQHTVCHECVIGMYGHKVSAMTTGYLNAAYYNRTYTHCAFPAAFSAAVSSCFRAQHGA